MLNLDESPGLSSAVLEDINFKRAMPRVKSDVHGSGKKSHLFIGGLGRVSSLLPTVPEQVWRRVIANLLS